MELTGTVSIPEIVGAIVIVPALVFFGLPNMFDARESFDWVKRQVNLNRPDFEMQKELASMHWKQERGRCVQLAILLGLVIYFMTQDQMLVSVRSWVLYLALDAVAISIAISCVRQRRTRFNLLELLRQQRERSAFQREWSGEAPG